MENNYDAEFDRLFARDLKAAGKNAQPDPPEWSKLSKRLDPGARRRPGALLLLWLLVPALLGGNVWALFQGQQLRTEISSLKQQLASISAPSPHSARHTENVYDTVYHTIIITRKIMNQGYSGNYPGSELSTKPEGISGVIKSAAELGSFTSKNAGSEKEETLPVGDLSKKDPAEQNKAELKDNAIADAGKKDSTVLQNRLPDQVLHDSISNPDAGFLVKIAEKDSLSTRTPKRVTEPLRWRLAAGMGFFGPLQPVGLGFPSGLSTAVSAEILLGRHWGIVPALTFATGSFVVKGDIAQALLFEAPNPPGPGFELKHIEGNLIHWIPALSLRYRFQPEKRWSWYLGTGYSARFTVANHTEIEYLEQGTNLEFKSEADIHIPDRLSFGLAQVGLERRLAGRWLLFGEANAMFDVGKGQGTFPILNVQAGVKWGLK